jgi:hypothetical protein
MSKSYWFFKNPYLRNWATPLTISSFILMSVTGVLMFFEWDQGLIVVVHQWFSWLFILGVVGHVIANIRLFKNNLTSRWGKASVLAFTLVLAASFFSWGLITGPQLKRPIEQALVEAPLSALAMVTHTVPDVLMHRLKAHGIDANGKQSIRDLVIMHDLDENRLLEIVFLSK